MVATPTPTPPAMEPEPEVTTTRCPSNAGTTMKEADRPLEDQRHRPNLPMAAIRLLLTLDILITLRATTIISIVLPRLNQRMRKHPNQSLSAKL